ncbi:MAG: hypothetical protein MUD00_01520 [Candidatus Pacebacteria bacterium]|jgi:hypothetical protein|nr:hypothetical protein [Candidatus Paceibacterota bacterium]
MVFKILFSFAITIAFMWAIVRAITKIMGLKKLDDWYVRKSKDILKFIWKHLFKVPAIYLWKHYKKEVLSFFGGVVITLIVLHQCGLI